MKLEFDYNDRHYCLEYTRDTVRTMEASGFNPNDIDEKPLLRFEQLWAGAFLANHRKVSNSIVKNLFEVVGKQNGVREALLNMIAETYESLLPKDDEPESEGNVTWTVTT